MTAFAFLAAAAAVVTKGRNRPIENPGVVETRRIDRLERDLRDAQKRNDVYLGAIERLQKDAAAIMRQRDAALLELATARGPFIFGIDTAGNTIMEPVPQTTDRSHPHQHLAQRLQAMHHLSMEWCNCVPARHDMLRPQRAQPSGAGHIVVDDLQMFSLTPGAPQ